MIVSSGDPGVFAMATAVMEAIDNGKKEWKKVEVSVLPGITAMLAASAKLGAPLGHDFCAINLSDNLKPWILSKKELLSRCKLTLLFRFIILGPWPDPIT